MRELCLMTLSKISSVLTLAGLTLALLLAAGSDRQQVKLNQRRRATSTMQGSMSQPMVCRFLKLISSGNSAVANKGLLNSGI